MPREKTNSRYMALTVSTSYDLQRDVVIEISDILTSDICISIHGNTEFKDKAHYHGTLYFKDKTTDKNLKVVKDKVEEILSSKGYIIMEKTVVCKHVYDIKGWIDYIEKDILETFNSNKNMPTAYTKYLKSTTSETKSETSSITTLSQFSKSNSKTSKKTAFDMDMELMKEFINFMKINDEIVEFRTRELLSKKTHEELIMEFKVESGCEVKYKRSTLSWLDTALQKCSRIPHYTVDSDYSLFSDKALSWKTGKFIPASEYKEKFPNKKPCYTTNRKSPTEEQLRECRKWMEEKLNIRNDDELVRLSSLLCIIRTIKKRGDYAISLVGISGSGKSLICNAIQEVFDCQVITLESKYSLAEIRPGVRIVIFDESDPRFPDTLNHMKKLMNGDPKLGVPDKGNRMHHLDPTHTIFVNNESPKPLPQDPSTDEIVHYFSENVAKSIMEDRPLADDNIYEESTYTSHISINHIRKNQHYLHCKSIHAQTPLTLSGLTSLIKDAFFHKQQGEFNHIDAIDRRTEVVIFDRPDGRSPQFGHWAEDQPVSVIFCLIMDNIRSIGIIEEEEEDNSDEFKPISYYKKMEKEQQRRREEYFNSLPKDRQEHVLKVEQRMNELNVPDAPL